VLFVLAPGPGWVVAAQATGGLTSAIIGIMTPLVISDVMRGSGRYNLAQGFAGTAQGVGGAVTNVAVGFLAHSFGYTAGFFTLAAIGACGLAVIFFLMPETMPSEFHPGRR
jgi:MFS family permease